MSAALLLAAALLGGGAGDVPRAAADLGRVDPPFAEPIQAIVPVRNAGASDAAIDRAVPHCAGCTRIAAVPRTIPAGATGEVRLLLEPGRSRGRLRFGATLLSGGAPWCVAEVLMLVPGIDAGSPGPIDLGSVAPGATLERAIPVRTIAAPGSACSVSVRGGALRARFGDDGSTAVPLGHGLEERHGRATVALDVPPDATEGTVVSWVDLELHEGGRALDRLSIEVRATVARPSSVVPAALFVTPAPGGSAREFEILLPSCGAAVEVDGARVLSVGADGAGARVRLLPDVAAAVPAHGLRRGEVRLRCGGAEHVVPWLGCDVGPDDDPPTAAAIRDLFAFKRDMIRASTSAYREDRVVSAELLRGSPPDAPPGSGVRITRSVFRIHDGCFRATAVRPDGFAGAEVTVSDGRTEARSGVDGSVSVLAEAGGAGHSLRAEWESLAGMLGSVARGTARDGLEDLAEAIERESPGGVQVTWDQPGPGGPRLLLVTLAGGSPMRVWLDPARGLAVVRREQSVDDGVVVDRAVWTADAFLRTPCGIELPGRIRSFQERGPSGSAERPGAAPRTVHTQSLRCLAFRIDPSAGDVDRFPERSVEQVRQQALAVWDEGHPLEEFR